VEEFELSGKATEEWSVNDVWAGKTWTVATNTSLSVPTVQPALFGRTKLYVDTAGGTVGATQKTGVLMAASLKFKTGWVYVPVGDGTLAWSAIKYTKPEFTFSITAELEDGGFISGERTAYRAETDRQFRLDIEGVSAATHLIRLSWAGKYDKVGGYENDNGNVTVTLEGHGIYNAAKTLFFTASVTNQIANLFA
jgi:hypothetical protein